MYEKINDDWNEIGEIGGKARDLAASKSHVIIATDKGIYSRGKNDYGLWFHKIFRIWSRFESVSFLRWAIMVFRLSREIEKNLEMAHLS